jgi:hypothetical protein
MKNKLYLGLFFLALSLSGTVSAGKYFWVSGGSGTWSASDVTNWSKSNGGSGGQGVPGMNDTAYFVSSSSSMDGSPVSVSISGSVSVNSIVFGNVLSGASISNMAATDSLSIYGSVYDSLSFVPPSPYSTSVVNLNCTVNFGSVNIANTLNLDSWVMTGKIIFNGFTGSSWTLQSDLNSYNSFGRSGGSNVFSLGTGTLNSNGFSIYVDSVYISSRSVFNVSAGSQIYLYYYWNANASARLSFSPLSTIVMMNSCPSCRTTGSNSSMRFYGGGLTYGNINLSPGYATSIYMYGKNTFDTVSVNFGVDTLFLSSVDSLKFNVLTTSYAYSAAIVGSQPDSTVLYDMNGGVNCLNQLGFNYVKAKGKGKVTYSDLDGIVTNSSGITVPSSIIVTNAKALKPSTCLDGDNAEIDVIASGGVLPHIDTWTTGGTSVTAGDTLKNAIGGAFYFVTVSDQCGNSGPSYSVSASNGSYSIQTPSISNDTIVCHGGGVEVPLTVSTATNGNVKYLWSVITGTPITGAHTSALLDVYPVTTSVYKVDITNGTCVDSLNVKVIVENPIAHVFPDSLRICQGTKFVLDGNSSTGVTTGVISPYWYSYGSGEYSSDSLSPTIKANILGSSTYYLFLSDPAYVCTSIDSAYVNVVDSLNNVYGQVTFNNGSGVIAPLSKGYVLLYRNNLAGKGIWPVVDSVTLTSNGSYTFDSKKIVAGEYIVRVFPDQTQYPLVPNMYYLSPRFINDTATFYWDSANVTMVSCGGNFSRNINIDALKNLTTSGGTSVINGSILAGPGYSGMALVHQFHQYQKNNSILSANDGIGGVGVGLGKKPNPSSNIIATTSTNSNGFYQFEDVPAGTYVIFADIPGLPMDSSYTVIITGNDSIPNRNYYANDSVIYIQNSLAGITPVKQPDALAVLSAYPNPYSGSVNLIVQVPVKSMVVLEVFNLLGERISVLERGELMEGSYQYTFSARDAGFSEGVYLVKLTANSGVYSQRIVELK